MNRQKQLGWENIRTLFETGHLTPGELVETMLDNAGTTEEDCPSRENRPLFCSVEIKGKGSILLTDVDSFFTRGVYELLKDTPSNTHTLCRVIRNLPYDVNKDYQYSLHDALLDNLSQYPTSDVLDAIADFIGLEVYIDLDTYPPSLGGTSEHAFEMAVELLIEYERTEVLDKLWELAECYYDHAGYSIHIASYIARLEGLDSVSRLSKRCLTYYGVEPKMVKDVANTILGFGVQALPYLGEPLFQLSTEYKDETIDYVVLEMILRFGNPGIEYLAVTLADSDFLLFAPKQKIDCLLGEIPHSLGLLLIHRLSKSQSEKEKLNHLLESSLGMIPLENVKQFITSEDPRIRNAAKVLLKMKNG